MKKKVAKRTAEKTTDNPEQEFPGYPIYPASEDITSQDEQKDLDPEKITRSSRINNQLAREDEPVEPTDLDEDLDVPGAELDDQNELIGEEDEENNYYSLGGDRHNDLEEDNDL